MRTPLLAALAVSPQARSAAEVRVSIEDFVIIDDPPHLRLDPATERRLAARLQAWREAHR